MADQFRVAHGVTVAPEPFGSTTAQRLRGELGRELVERYGGDSEPGSKPARDDVMVFLVARDGNGEPVGCGALRDLGGGVVEIKRIYVRPAARGGGVSRRLLEALEADARERGFVVCRLETGVRQPEAMALYRSVGYREIEGFGAYAGMPLSRCFERWLDAPESPA